MCKVTPAMPTWDLSPDWRVAVWGLGVRDWGLGFRLITVGSWVVSSYVLLSSLELSDTKVYEP